jgi:hypothetical protein
MEKTAFHFVTLVMTAETIENPETGHAHVNGISMYNETNGKDG